MGNYYRLVGSQGPGWVDRVQVEESTPDHPEKFLELNGAPVELENYQVERLGRYVKLEHVPDYDPNAEEAPVVDQPGVDAVSSSTERPPNTGIAPDLDAMNRDELVELAGARGVEVAGNAKKEDIKAAVAADIDARGV
jgi:hypothetical protein